jgi:hypothetical protein
MVEHQFSKLRAGVRFSYPAPKVEKTAALPQLFSVHGYDRYLHAIFTVYPSYIPYERGTIMS